MELQATSITTKKSEPLTKQEKRALKEYRAKFGTATDAAISLGISREVLIRVSLAGSGSPSTINKIRAVLSEVGGAR